MNPTLQVPPLNHGGPKYYIYTNPNTTSMCFLNTYRSGSSTTSLSILFQCLTTLSVWKCFPFIQSKPPLAQLEAISSHPTTCYLGEEADPHLAIASLQVLLVSEAVLCY